MAMTTAYLNATADHGASLITHLGLVDETGTEITGGSPAYARIPVSTLGGGWTAAADGLIRPGANAVFDIPSGVTVGGWRGYSALAAGVDYGGQDLTNQPFASQGTYTLLAASTAVDHDAV